MDNRVMHQHNHHTLSTPQNHNSHQWNYTSTITTLPAPQTSTPIISGQVIPSSPNVWTPPTTRGIKRAMSESDCDDMYSEESSKDHQSALEDGCHTMNRKKRRGVIEKKRRDRINSSLTELKRLVPSAFEKQGSAKLEKAEILQLTVDHLRSLHSKGIDSISGFDPQRFAMDYHIIGFRECASEVARYLVTIEGMDIQDPLRLRLMSHLQCFVAQRELSAKSSSSSSATNYTYQPNYPNQGYQSYPAASPITPHQQPNQSMFNSSYMSSSGSSFSYLNSTLPHSPEYTSSGYSTLSSSTPSSANTSLNNNNTSTVAPTTTTTEQSTEESQQQQQPIYTDLTSQTQDRLMGNYSYTNHLNASANNQGYNYNNNNNNSSKPYRPWHPEMAY